MNFTPAIPLSGVAGLQFLERTEEQQRAAFDSSPLLSREVEYFKENIANVTTAEQLVNDRMLFKVALGAFGLDDEIDKKYFMQRMLEEGTENSDALAVRFVDPAYAEFSEAFGFGNATGAATGQSDFAQRITDTYKELQFEVAVGEVDTDLRLGMGFKREIVELATSTTTDSSFWLSVLGSLPVRTVFETAFGLSSSIAALDLDQQVEMFQERTQRLLGDGGLTAFLDADNIDQMVNQFMVQSQIQNGPSQNTPGFAALSLLSNSQSGASGAIGQINLILANAQFS